ncbi:MAG: hydrogenase maturation nickel metallochaperone HypA [Desulfovibrionaceae bacterium]
MSLIQSIMDIVEEERAKHGLGRLTRVTLSNGQLAGAVTDSLTFAWEALTPGTDLEGCELVVNEVPMGVRCGGCGKEYEPEDRLYMPCPFCGREFGHDVVRGRELRIESIEAEEAPGAEAAESAQAAGETGPAAAKAEPGHERTNPRQYDDGTD